MIECHRAQFRDECFPQQFEGFTRICTQPIDVDQSVWTGQQLLVVYASARYLKELRGHEQQRLVPKPTSSLASLPSQFWPPS